MRSMAVIVSCGRGGAGVTIKGVGAGEGQVLL